MKIILNWSLFFIIEHQIKAWAKLFSCFIQCCRLFEAFENISTDMIAKLVMVAVFLYLLKLNHMGFTKYLFWTFEDARKYD